MALASGMANGAAAEVPIGGGSERIPTLPPYPCPSGVNSPIVVTATCERCCTNSLSAASWPPFRPLVPLRRSKCSGWSGGYARIRSSIPRPRCNSPHSVTFPSLQQRIKSLGNVLHYPSAVHRQKKEELPRRSASQNRLALSALDGLLSVDQLSSFLFAVT